MHAVRNIHAGDVRERLRTSPDAVMQLLDVREHWEYELVHLPGAILIPLAELPSRLRELNVHAPVIVYCHHGIRSWHAACFLVQNGFDEVGNLAGGIDAWARDLDPSLPRY